MQEFSLNIIWRKQNFQRAQKKRPCQINLEFIWWSKFGQPRAAAVNYDTSPELSKHFYFFFSRPVQTDRSCETGASKSTSAPSRLLRRRKRKIGQRGSTASYFYLRRGRQVLERWELLLLLLLLWGV